MSLTAESPVISATALRWLFLLTFLLLTSLSNLQMLVHYKYLTSSCKNDAWLLHSNAGPRRSSTLAVHAVFRCNQRRLKIIEVSHNSWQNRLNILREIFLSQKQPLIMISKFILINKIIIHHWTNATNVKHDKTTINLILSSLLPTMRRGGVSKMVTASTTSFLLTLEPGLSTSRTIWVIPALYPTNAVKWIGFDGSSFGKAFTFPRWRRLRFFGRNCFDPWRGALNFRWLWKRL